MSEQGPVTSHLPYSIWYSQWAPAVQKTMRLLCGVWMGCVQSLAWSHTEAGGKAVSFERWPCNPRPHLLWGLG